jgi:hypothetical protein
MYGVTMQSGDDVGYPNPRTHKDMYNFQNAPFARVRNDVDSIIACLRTGSSTVACVVDLKAASDLRLVTDDKFKGSVSGCSAAVIYGYDIDAQTLLIRLFTDGVLEVEVPFAAVTNATVCDCMWTLVPMKASCKLDPCDD